MEVTGSGVRIRERWYAAEIRELELADDRQPAVAEALIAFPGGWRVSLWCRAANRRSVLGARVGTTVDARVLDPAGMPVALDNRVLPSGRISRPTVAAWIDDHDALSLLQAVAELDARGWPFAVLAPTGGGSWSAEQIRDQDGEAGDEAEGDIGPASPRGRERPR